MGGENTKKVATEGNTEMVEILMLASPKVLPGNAATVNGHACPIILSQENVNLVNDLLCHSKSF